MAGAMAPARAAGAGKVYLSSGQPAKGVGTLNWRFLRRSGMTSRTVDIYDPLTAVTQIRIQRIDVISTPVLRVVFDDGAAREIDFSSVIARSRWFHTLAVPTTFESVEIVNSGRALQWVTGADFCADALRIMADEQLAAKGTDA
jgi:hypothetical protein